MAQKTCHHQYPLLLLVFLLLLTLTACGTSPAAEQAPATTSESPEAAPAGSSEHNEEDEHADYEDEHADEHEDEHADHDHEHENEHNAENTDIKALIAELGPIATGETLNVVATTNIIGDIVSQVGGASINLTTLMPVGADPHTFEPTPQEVGMIADADIVFVNGFDLEESLIPVITNSGIAPERIIPVSVGVETIEFGVHDEHDHDHEHEGEEHHDDHEDEEQSEDEQSSNLLDLFADTALASDTEEHDHEHSGLDPHTWMSPINVIVWTNNIAEVLAALDPANADTYTSNADTYIAELNDLDTWITEQLAQIPAANRKLVTDHTAFGYYAQEYDLEQIGAVVPAYSTMAEASAQELAALQETITELAIPAIFVGTTVNPDLAEQIAADLGIQLLPVYTGSLSDADGPAPTYLDMMRYNTDQIVNGLAS
ncbi:MAG: zinc ABC transporter solute-binding protein [Chloroflexaceae bacterium]|nr:zinc ABC transporter solute-binding protein [Chloroflexaceae bacterium]